MGDVPPLTTHQVQWALHQVARWLYTRSQWEHHTAPPRAGLNPQVLSQIGIDADHSGLLYRLLSGKDPLPHPPPTSFSRPDYARVEGKDFKHYPNGWRVNYEVGDSTIIFKHKRCEECRNDEGYLRSWSKGPDFRVRTRCTKCGKEIVETMNPQEEGKGDG